MGLGLGLLILGHFLAKHAFRWLVDSPHHVMDAPIKGELSIFLDLRFAVLGRDLLPCLVFLLFALVRRVTCPSCSSWPVSYLRPCPLCLPRVQLELPFLSFWLSAAMATILSSSGDGCPTSSC